MRALSNPLLQAVTDGVIILDDELNIQFMNHAAEAMTGVSVAADRVRKITSLGGGELGIRTGQLCLDAIIENRVVTGVQEFSGRVLHLQIFPTRDGCQLLLRGDDVPRAAGSQQHTLHLQHVLEGMPASFVFIDTKFNVLAWSDRFKNYVTKCTDRELRMGEDVFLFMAEQDVPKLRERMTRALAGEVLQVDCTFHLPAENREVWARQYYLPVHNDQGHLLGLAYYGFNIDAEKKAGQELHGLAYYGFNIDAEKKAGQELHESLNRLSLMLKATNDAVWEWNLPCGGLSWNENFFNLFGYHRGDIEENPRWWDDNIHPEDRQRVLEGLDEAVRAQRPRYQNDYRFRCRNGTYKYVHDSCYILYNHAGQASRMVGAMQDIDYMKVQEEKLVQQNQVLRNVAFVQSHLIRKPAANIIALQKMLETFLSEELKRNPDLRQIFGHMEDSVKELDMMIHASVARIEESGMKGA